MADTEGRQVAHYKTNMFLDEPDDLTLSDNRKSTSLIAELPLFLRRQKNLLLVAEVVKLFHR